MQKSLAGLQLFLETAERGDLLIIDEPELSAHPEAQVKLVELFALMIRRGIQLVLITHSPYILDRLSTLLELARLSEEQRARVADVLALGNPDAYVTPDEVAVCLPDRTQGGSLRSSARREGTHGRHLVPRQALGKAAISWAPEPLKRARSRKAGRAEMGWRGFSVQRVGLPLRGVWCTHGKSPRRASATVVAPCKTVLRRCTGAVAPVQGASRPRDGGVCTCASSDVAWDGGALSPCNHGERTSLAALARVQGTPRKWHGSRCAHARHASQRARVVLRACMARLAGGRVLLPARTGRTGRWLPRSAPARVRCGADVAGPRARARALGT
ncbi:AAA family ATPase [Polyangium fumosum]